MNKEYLDHVTFVKESLRVWLSNVEQSHLGIQMFSNENDLNRENTEFYKWYFNEGQTFSSFETFRVLEAFYDRMYDSFIAYNELKEKPIKKGLFTNHAEKRKQELDALYVEVRQSARQLIKSVEIFEDNLKTSPLFETTDKKEEVSQKPIDAQTIDINKDEESSISHNSVEVIEETAVDKTVELSPSHSEELKQQKVEASIEKKSPQESAFDFEKRLQEEVEKIKEQLKKELLESQEKPESQKKSESPDDSIKKKVKEEPFKPVTKSNQDTPDLDIDEEIRRILS